MIGAWLVVGSSEGWGTVVLYEWSNRTIVRVLYSSIIHTVELLIEIFAVPINLLVDENTGGRI